jgi:DUF971 family protein
MGRLFLRAVARVAFALHPSLGHNSYWGPIGCRVDGLTDGLITDHQSLTETMKRRYPAVMLVREMNQLVIDWPDDHHSEYALADVRAACPCAECDSRRRNSQVAPEAGSAVKDMRHVGNYAIQFVWSDGHSFGIYPWELLRRMCPCAICRLGTESE